MSLFGPIDSAGSALGTYQTWMDAIAGNIANQNDITAVGAPSYRSVQVVAQASMVDSDQVGTSVAGTTQGPGPNLIYQPSNPLANKQGYVQVANVDMSAQMTDLISAQRGYEMNASVVTQAVQAYQSALQMGR